MPGMLQERKKSTGFGRGGRGRGRDKKDKDGRKSKGSRVFRKKVCKFCIEKSEFIEYKDVLRLQKFLTEKGKIVPRRISGNCAYHQRMLASTIKRARQMALIVFTGE
jgi:small subunit ribosomal protein S18